jgi:hypothetical protein
MTEDEILDALRARLAQGRPTDLERRRGAPQPVSAEAIEEAERVVGHALPPLLRRIYGEIANGGVGPFGGIEGLSGGYSSGPSMLKKYVSYLQGTPEPDAPPPPPPGVLFFCDFGCATWTLLDCRHPQGQMWWWDQGDRHKLNLTLPEWLGAWLASHLRDTLADAELILPDDSWSHPSDR